MNSYWCFISGDEAIILLLSMANTRGAAMLLQNVIYFSPFVSLEARKQDTSAPASEMLIYKYTWTIAKC